MSPPVFCMSSGFGADFVWTIFCNVLISIFQRSSNICNINSNINIWRISQRCKLTLETSSASCFARPSDIFASEKFYCLIIVFVCLYFCICICLQCYFWSCSIYRGVFFSSLQDTTSSTNWHITFNVPRIDHKKTPKKVKVHWTSQDLSRCSQYRSVSEYSCVLPNFYPNLPIFLHRYIRHICDILQLCLWKHASPLTEWRLISSVARYWVILGWGCHRSSQGTFYLKCAEILSEGRCQQTWSLHKV